MNHLELAYVVVEVPDPDALAPVFDEVVALKRGEPSGAGAMTWRNDDRVHRLIVTEGELNDISVAGFEVADHDVFDATIERLRSLGHQVVEGDDDLLGERSVERLARVAAPWGRDVELVIGLATADRPFESPAVPGGFLTEGVGMGHVVFATMNFEESAAFLTDGLGFGRSDRVEFEIAEGVPMRVSFYHCNERHHTVALAHLPFELPQVLHHVMFEMNRRDDVGEAFDRLWTSGLGIPNGLGRHENDGMFSFYLQTPAGFQVEVGHGARTVGPDWDDDRIYDAVSLWGHQPLRQP